MTKTKWYLVKGKDIDPSLNADALVSSIDAGSMIVAFPQNIELAEQKKFLDVLYGERYKIDLTGDRRYCITIKPQLTLK